MTKEHHTSSDLPRFAATSPDSTRGTDTTAPGAHSAAANGRAAANTAAHKQRRKKLLTTVLAGSAALALVAGGTAAWAIDRFVVDKVEISDVAAYEASQQASTSTSESAATTASSNTATAATDTASGSGSTGSTMTTAATSEPVVTDSTYTSDNTQITISQVTTGSGNDTVTYYVADVQLSDATALKSAFANNAFGQSITEKVSSMATNNGAVLAINGDYYGFRDTGIVIRNGVVYRDSGARQGLAIYRDGTMQVYDETSTNAQALLDAGVWQTLSFGPALVQDGQVVSGIDNIEIDTNFGNHSIQGSHPRTAIGIIDDNHFIFVVVDGREKGYSRGATMTELAQIMADLGATTAYNLDGGGSSEIWFNGQVINQPSNGGERATSDILYIAQGA